MNDITPFALIEPSHENSFEPYPYVDAGTDVESYNTISVRSGRWFDSGRIITFAGVENIGSSTNKYIVADFSTGSITAQSSAPLATDTTKRLLFELVYVLYTIDPNEYPDNPAFKDQQAITNWKRYQFGDIYTGYPWDKVLFGYTISGTTFTVKEGEFEFLGTIYTVGEQALTIASNDDYIFAQFDYANHTVLIGHTTTKANATSNAQYFRKWLYKLSFVSSFVSVALYGHTGGGILVQAGTIVGSDVRYKGLQWNSDNRPVKDWVRAHV